MNPFFLLRVHMNLVVVVVISYEMVVVVVISYEMVFWSAGCKNVKNMRCFRCSGIVSFPLKFLPGSYEPGFPFYGFIWTRFSFYGFI